MRLQRQSTNKLLPGRHLDWGMEVRRVFAVPQDETLVAKVYHSRLLHAQKKLVAMLANPPENPTGQGHISIVGRLTCWEGGW